MSRPASALTWTTCRLDQGRLSHPVFSSLYIPGELFPILTDWGATLSQVVHEFGPEQGWHPVKVDERFRTLLPIYMREHLGVSKSGTVLTAASGTQLHLVAPHAVEAALGIRDYVNHAQAIDAEEAERESRRKR